MTSILPLTRQTALSLLLLAPLVLVLARTAWVAEDAFITFRVVEQFWAGHGLVWNSDERVQVYTHPLWLLSLLALRPLTLDLYTIALGLGFAFSLATIVLLLRLARTLPAQSLIVVLLASSAAFVDYSTSGLENALSHVLAALLVTQVLAFSSTSRAWFALGLVSALMVLTRPDHAVLVSGVGFALLLSFRPGWRRMSALAAGALPLIAWALFALVYYGSPFPNTAFAKLNHELPATAIIPHGLAYLQDALLHDPVTPLTILVGLALGLTRKDARSLALSLGLFVALVYVVWVGGDYMRGRFLSTLFVVAVGLLVMHATHWSIQRTLPIAALFLVTGMLNASTPLRSGADYANAEITPNGIADERGYYYPYTGLLRADPRLSLTTHVWTLQGKTLATEGVTVAAACNVGMRGYAAPLDTYIIDPLALTEPFLAQLPTKRPFRIGHFERAFPAGFVESKLVGKNRLQDTYLNQVYADILIITQGSLWSWDRWTAIWRLNTGALRDKVRQAQFDRDATGTSLVANPVHTWDSCMGVRGAPMLILARNGS